MRVEYEEVRSPLEHVRLTIYFEVYRGECSLTGEYGQGIALAEWDGVDWEG